MCDHYIVAEDHTVAVVKTPAVLAAVQQHFGCNNVTGGELENYGGSGTSGSHWEKRAFFNEYMTGTSSKHPVYSNITLALFHDMGWYNVNFSMAQTLVWGKGLGM